MTVKIYDRFTDCELFQMFNVSVGEMLTVPCKAGRTMNPPQDADQKANKLRNVDLWNVNIPKRGLSTAEKAERKRNQDKERENRVLGYATAVTLLGDVASPDFDGPPLAELLDQPEFV